VDRDQASHNKQMRDQSELALGVAVHYSMYIIGHSSEARPAPDPKEDVGTLP
jgi:hypothetical protein